MQKIVLGRKNMNGPLNMAGSIWISVQSVQVVQAEGINYYLNYLNREYLFTWPSKQSLLLEHWSDLSVPVVQYVSRMWACINVI